VVHDALNGDQTLGTVNASPIAPLNQAVNFVVFSNVHVSGGTLNVDVGPTSPVPSHNPNAEADINGAQLQLVSYDVSAPTVTVDQHCQRISPEPELVARASPDGDESARSVDTHLCPGTDHPCQLRKRMRAPFYRVRIK